jgi:hypothetical protein
MLAYPKDARMHHFGPHPLITVEGVHIREPANRLELDQIMPMTLFSKDSNRIISNQIETDQKKTSQVHCASNSALSGT